MGLQVPELKRSTATFHGEGAPDNTLGSNGDTYIRADGRTYAKALGQWQVSVKSIAVGDGNAMPVPLAEATPDAPGAGSAALFVRDNGEVAIRLPSGTVRTLVGRSAHVFDPKAFPYNCKADATANPAVTDGTDDSANLELCIRDAEALFLSTGVRSTIEIEGFMRLDRVINVGATPISVPIRSGGLVFRPKGGKWSGGFKNRNAQTAIFGATGAFRQQGDTITSSHNWDLVYRYGGMVLGADRVYDASDATNGAIRGRWRVRLRSNPSLVTSKYPVGRRVYLQVGQTTTNPNTPMVNSEPDAQMMVVVKNDPATGDVWFDRPLKTDYHDEYQMAHARISRPGVPTELFGRGHLPRLRRAHASGVTTLRLDRRHGVRNGDVVQLGWGANREMVTMTSDTTFGDHTINCAALGASHADNEPLTMTWLMDAASAGATSLRLNDTFGFEHGDVIRLEGNGGATAEEVTMSSVPSCFLSGSHNLSGLTTINVVHDPTTRAPEVGNPTDAFPSSGELIIPAPTGSRGIKVTYTGKTATSFTGVDVGGATGTVGASSIHRRVVSTTVTCTALTNAFDQYDPIARKLPVHIRDIEPVTNYGMRFEGLRWIKRHPTGTSNFACISGRGAIYGWEVEHCLIDTDCSFSDTIEARDKVFRFNRMDVAFSAGGATSRIWPAIPGATGITHVDISHNIVNAPDRTVSWHGHEGAAVIVMHSNFTSNKALGSSEPQYDFSSRCRDIQVHHEHLVNGRTVSAFHIGDDIGDIDVSHFRFQGTGPQAVVWNYSKTAKIDERTIELVGLVAGGSIRRLFSRVPMLRQRPLTAWISVGDHAPELEVNLGPLQRDEYISRIEILKIQGFNSDGTDELSLGTASAPELFGKKVAVNASESAGPEAPILMPLGTGAWFWRTNAIEDMILKYHAGGSAPTVGRVLVKIHTEIIPSLPAS